MKSIDMNPLTDISQGMPMRLIAVWRDSDNRIWISGVTEVGTTTTFIISREKAIELCELLKVVIRG